MTVEAEEPLAPGEPARCFNCGRVCDDDDECHTCEAHVCMDCDSLGFVEGHHDPEAHLGGDA